LRAPKPSLECETDVEIGVFSKKVGGTSSGPHFILKIGGGASSKKVTYRRNNHHERW